MQPSWLCSSSAST